MDKYDVADAKQARSSRRKSWSIWNVLTIIILLITACMAIFTLVLLIYPDSFVNPFPPPTYVAPQPTPTVTKTLKVVFQPSWTPTATIVLPTKTPRPTNTPYATDTPPGMTDETPTQTFTPAPYSFEMQQGSPVAIPNLFYPDLGCDWMGVGGQVLDMSGGAVIGLTVRLGGTLNGKTIDLVTLTGVNQAYGDGGFEFKLADEPIASSQTLYIQLFDQADLPMSDKLYFNTFSDCQKSLVVINIVQVQ